MKLFLLIAIFVAIVMVNAVPLQGEKGETAIIADDLDTAEMFAKSYGKPKAPKSSYGSPQKAKKEKAPKASYGSPQKAKKEKAPKASYGAPKAKPQKEKAPKSSYGKPKKEKKPDSSYGRK
ncbi:small ribosomal subunit protein bS16-like isoform X1 [Daphnia carinata]|uniref:small ribosomal subunit protein bS16-like isoform X1 n=1 Tax=Daphnia carinata TaxID=120202 RepID=UPI00257DC68C|nr:small ribosomal subunit protein bS16-like isoform X1 [Daphnia carinata]